MYICMYLWFLCVHLWAGLMNATFVLLPGCFVSLPPRDDDYVNCRKVKGKLNTSACSVELCFPFLPCLWACKTIKRADINVFSLMRWLIMLRWSWMEVFGNSYQLGVPQSLAAVGKLKRKQQQRNKRNTLRFPTDKGALTHIDTHMHALCTPTLGRSRVLIGTFIDFSCKRNRQENRKLLKSISCSKLS